MLTRDGSGNRERECLCVHDYNDIVSDMINGMSESTDFPAQEIGGLQLPMHRFTKKDLILKWNM